MTTPVWPSTLPPPLARSPQYAPSFDNVMKSPMDSGAIKRRPRFTAVPETFKCQIMLDAATYATFKTFVETTLAFTGTFTWSDWRTGVSADYAFLSLPSYTHEGAGYWVADFELIQA